MRPTHKGAVAVLEGPYGEFSYRTSVRPEQVWVAGGIGITPFLSMARSLEPSEREVELYYGVKSRPAAYFADELAALQDRGVLKLHVVPEDEEGFVQIASSGTWALSRTGTSICAGRPRWSEA